MKERGRKEGRNEESEVEEVKKECEEEEKKGVK